MRLVPPVPIVILALAAPVAAQNTASQVPIPPPPIRVIPAPPPPPRPGATASPVPVTNPGTWVTTDDYPAWAAANKVGGTVGFSVDVDAAGRVVKCEVRQSSGVDELDRIACEKITERGRFRPARDPQGNPTAGQWHSRVRWDIPADVPEPAPKPGGFVASMIIERDGSVSECVIESAEGIAAGIGDVAGICEDVGPFEPVLDTSGKPQRQRVRLTTLVEREPLP